MGTLELSAIIVIVLALIAIFALRRNPDAVQRIKARFPFGSGIEVETSPVPHQPAALLEDGKAGGSVLVEAPDGGGAHGRRIEAGNDLTVSSGSSGSSDDPKADASRE